MCHFPKDHPWHDDQSLPRWHTFRPASDFGLELDLARIGVYAIVPRANFDSLLVRLADVERSARQLLDAHDACTLGSPSDEQSGAVYRALASLRESLGVRP
jgi:hypothetical protein